MHKAKKAMAISETLKELGSSIDSIVSRLMKNSHKAEAMRHRLISN
jgi:hypothetical protein